MTADASSSAVSFKSLAGMLSGPEAEKGLRFLSSLMAPFWSTMMLSMDGCWLFPRSGTGEPSSTEKTEINYRFNMLALVFGST